MNASLIKTSLFVLLYSPELLALCSGGVSYFIVRMLPKRTEVKRVCLQRFLLLPLFYINTTRAMHISFRFTDSDQEE